MYAGPRRSFPKHDILRSKIATINSWLKLMQEEKEEKRLNNKKRKTRMPVHQQRKCPDYWIIQTIENDMAEVRKLLQEYDEKEGNTCAMDLGSDDEELPKEEEEEEEQVAVIERRNPRRKKRDRGEKREREEMEEEKVDQNRQTYHLGPEAASAAYNDDDDEDFEPATHDELVAQLELLENYKKTLQNGMEETWRKLEHLGGDGTKEKALQLRQVLIEKLEKARHQMRNRKLAWLQYVSSELARNFNIVGIPHFQTHLMIRRAGRRIGKTTARLMGNIPFGKLRRYTRFQCAKQQDTFFIVTNEAYTTRIHGKCLHLNNRYTTSSRKCAGCHEHINRDQNSAMTQYIKVVPAMNNLQELQ